MADDKDDKPGREHASVNDSGELLKALFREELDAIAAEKKKKIAAKTSDKRSARKKAKSGAQGKGAGRKKVGPETGTEERKIVKNYPVSEVQVGKPRKVASNTDTSLKKEVEEETAPQIRDDIPEEVRPEESVKTKQLKGGKVRFGGNPSVASDKLKVALLSVLLVAAVAFLLSSLGVVDFSQLLGLSEPAKKAGRKTRVARKPPAKRSTPVAPVSTEKATHSKASDEATAPKVQPDVAKAASLPAEQTPEKAALGKEIVFPGKRNSSYPYSIYLGSYKTRERAERSISEYRNKGLSPYWVKVDLGDKGVWYRVFSGYFQKREQANEFIKKNQITDSESRHTRYANLIGLFAFQRELEEEKLRLSKLGYSPYVIPYRNGQSLLYIGAFYRKARALRQHAELASKGIHSKIVER